VSGSWATVLLVALAALAAAMWPRAGLIPRLGRWRIRRDRERIEDALKHLSSREHEGRAASVESLASAVRMARRRIPGLLARMEAAGLLDPPASRMTLSSEGERWALHVVRAHRLLERYLADEAGMPIERIHRAAERAEHHRTAQELDALDAHLGHPRTDPHGDPIPESDGALPGGRATPLPGWPAGQPAEIVHLEDEPEIIFRQIQAAGLRPGTIVRVLETDPSRVVISDGRDEHRLSPEVAGNVHVAAPRAAEPAEEGIVPLSDLPRGGEALVTRLSPACRGFTRRRLLDMGLTPGTRVRAEMRAAWGDPLAFRVRGTLIALRRDQARAIHVRPIGEDARGGGRPAREVGRKAAP
jgi:DtxR family Mn-dependent transcriptional regulator